MVFIHIVFYKLSYSIILQPASGIFHSTKVRRELSTLVHRNHFFFLHCSKYFTVWMCHILFNWSPIDGYLECFYFSTMTNRLHNHLCTPCTLGQMFPGVDNRDVDLLGHRVCTFHNLTDIANCSSQDWTNLFPICSVHEILLSPTSLSTFDLIKLKFFCQ